mmetsp:Transcript_64212/g.88212  ORF Transcript_64212/g.88212 Transcript_64212/m.88212 type:complete len:96 (-) Transcript_64212:324-611(-)
MKPWRAETNEQLLNSCAASTSCRTTTPSMGPTRSSGTRLGGKSTVGDRLFHIVSCVEFKAERRGFLLDGAGLGNRPGWEGRSSARNSVQFEFSFK